MNSRSLAVDNLRALAAIIVTIYHLLILLELPQVKQISSWGMIGVDLFFMLSGFLITSSLTTLSTQLPARQALKRYGIARVCRILPAYYISLSTVLLLAVATSDGAWTYSRTFGIKIAQHLVFLSYFVDKDSGFGFNGAYWTLSIEMLWYLVVIPIAYMRLTSRGISALVAMSLLYLIALDLGWLDFLIGYPPETPSYVGVKHFWEHQLPGQMIFFSLGALWWRYSLRAKAPKKFAPSRLEGIHRLVLWTFVCAVCWYCGSLEWTSVTLTYVVMAMAAGVIFVATLSFEHLASSTLAWVGKISYSLYLWHFPLIILSKRTNAMLHLGPPAFFLTYGLTLLAISALSFYLVEAAGLALKVNLVEPAIQKAFPNPPATPPLILGARH